MAALSLMRGEPFLSRLAAVATFVIYPASFATYALIVPDDRPKNTRSTIQAVK